MITVVLADDQPLVRRGLEDLLNAEPDIEVVGVAKDGRQALEIVRTKQPDVACLDIRMPQVDGIQATRELGSEVAVLILTTFDIDDYVFGALEAGVSGFLLKDAAPEVLADTVRNVAAGNGTIDQSLTKRIMHEFSQRRKLQPIRAVPAGSNGAHALLTTRESEILRLLAQGMSNADIAQRLQVEQSTVKSHLARMLPKLGVASRLQAVVWAYQNQVVAVNGEDA